MIAFSYYDKNKNILPKAMSDNAKYVKVRDAIVLERKKDTGIVFPFIYGSIQNWKYIILSWKDNVVKYLYQNIKSSWWNVLWYKLVKDIIPTGIWKDKKQETNYDISYYNNEINLWKAKALRAGLRNINNELDISDKLIDVKNLIDETVEPSKIVSKFLTTEYEQKDIIYSDTLWVVIDLKNTKKNISWVPFDCLYRISQGSVTKLNELIDTFWIDWVELWDIFYVYSYKDDDRLEFRKDWVFRNKVSWDQETETNLLNIAINLIGYTDSRYDINKRALEDKPIRYYYMEIDWELELIEYSRNPDNFNSKYWKNWMRFLESNKSLQLFYNGLDDWIEKENLSEYKLIYENWIDLKDKIWIHWWEIMYNENELDYINYAPQYAVNLDKEQITLQEVYDKLDWYYKKPYHHLIILWLLGSWLKPEFTKRKINIPLMLCSWYTESWKTEMIKMIMWLFGYAFNSTDKKPRLLSLEWTTVFPVVRALTDLAPIFFDELTGSVKKEVEEALRSVFNNQNIEKGNIDQSITTYIQQAPVIVWWERMPAYQSVLNRSIYLPFTRELRWNKTIYSDIKQYLSSKSITDDMWNIINHTNIDEKINEIWKALDMWRLWENYIFLRYINNIFDYMPKDKLKNIIKELKERQDKTIKWTDELFIFFSELLSQNKLSKSYVMSEKDWVFKIWLYVPEEYVRTKAQYIQDIKKSSYDDTINNSNIDINMTKIMEGRTDENKQILDIVMRFFRWVKDPVWNNFLEEKIWIEDF